MKRAEGVEDAQQAHSASARCGYTRERLLAGGVVDRVVVGGPAWHALGAEAWAAYSRHADLGNGVVAYPMEAIGGALLIISAAVSNHFDRSGNSAVTIQLYCAVVFSLAGLALTVKAAPIMLGLAELQSGSATQSALDEFFLWELYLRGIGRADFRRCHLVACWLERKAWQFALIGSVIFVIRLAKICMQDPQQPDRALSPITGVLAVDVFGLALAPSFLRAICSIPSFGIAKFAVNIWSPDTNKNANKTDGSRELLLVFSMPRENFSEKSGIEPMA